MLGSVTRRVWERRGLKEADQERMSPQERYDLQLEMFAERKKAEEEIGPHFISDRTMLDHYAYCLFRNYTMITNEKYDSLTAEVAENLSTYDLIVYFPIVFVPPADGLRQDGIAYNACIDAIIQSKLPVSSSYFGNSCVFMHEGTPLQRATTVVAEIKKITPIFWRKPT